MVNSAATCLLLSCMRGGARPAAAALALRRTRRRVRS